MLEGEYVAFWSSSEQSGIVSISLGRLELVKVHTVQHGWAIIATYVYHNMSPVFICIDSVQVEEWLGDILDRMVDTSDKVHQVEGDISVTAPLECSGH